MSDRAGFSEGYVQDCYHEAAHAVFYRRAGVTVHGVSVPPGSTGGQGLTNVDEVGQSPSPQQALDVAAGDLAGWYAEYRRVGKGVRCEAFDGFVAKAEDGAWGFGMTLADVLKTVPPHHTPDDFLHALMMLDLAAGSAGNPRALEGLYEEVCREVERGLQDRWPEVEAVAARLVEAGQLDAEEIAEALEGASGEG